MKKTIGLVLAVMMMVFGAGVVMNERVFAESQKDGCEATFLGLRPWHAGLAKDANCNILSPVGGLDGGKMATFVWTIVLNVLSTMFSLIGFVMIGVFAYGGVKQIMSRGDPSAVVAGKKAMANGLIGLVIMLLAVVIINTIIGVLIR